LSDTETDFWKFTASWLDRLTELEPLPTGYPTDCRPLPGVKAVIFDIYGTLLISASGDVEVTQVSAAAAREALAALNLSQGAEEHVADFLRDTIRRHHSRSPYPHPEVDIVSVWADMMASLELAGLACSEEGVDPRRLALAFELANNPVYPMPDARGVLASLSRSGYPLGIVSNAQFFTPLTLEHFLPDWPFDNDLVVYSYRHMRAKPDPFLFEELTRGLAARGLEPADALYVGNDMLNDIATAGAAGLKTCLFAGDRRSLRLREKHPEIARLQPDRAIDQLGQLLGIVGERASEDLVR
jgi:putative hydrolase of the HAD superfamily